METKMQSTSGHRRVARATVAGAVSALIAIATGALPAHAGTAEQAVRIHNRIAGVPPSATVLANMVTALNSGDTATAVKYATDNPNFYNVTLKNFAAPWTNRDQTVFVPLNDYTATVIGMVRDNVPFNTLLSADMVYVGTVSGAPPYSASSNAHYEYLDDNNIDLSDTNNLQQRQQSVMNPELPADATAGIMTTRAAARAFFILGTNRAMFR